MHRARVADGRSLGRLLGDSVTSAIQTLLLIGGFIIVFSVLVHLMYHVGLIVFFAKIAAKILDWLTIPTVLAHSWITGIFEITLGSQMTSATSNSIPLIYKLMIVSLIMGWNGLSIHAQVISMLSRTDIRYIPYFFAKIFHGGIAAIIMWIIYDPLQPYLRNSPVFTNEMLSSSFPAMMWEPLKWFSTILAIGWLGYQILLWKTNKRD
jgi:nucleoside recognition membrane protein YjiH